MPKPNEFELAGAVKQANGDYIYPNGVVLPDPFKNRTCQGILSDGTLCKLSTFGRQFYFRPSEPRWPAKVAVTCPDCRGREEQREAFRELRRKELPASTPPPPETSLRSVDEVLGDLDRLLGD